MNFLGSLLFTFSLFLPLSGVAQDFLKHDIEDEHQNDFPGIPLKSSGQKIPVHVIDTNSFVFVKNKMVDAGTQFKISSYIIAKDLLDSTTLKSLSNKSSKNEILTVFKSSDPKIIKQFILKMAEKRRTSQSKDEVKLMTDMSIKNKTDDDPASTTYFKTGMIEVLPPNNSDSDTRFFIPLEQINDITFSPDNTKITLLKSLSLLGFKKSKSNIQYGNLDEATINILKQSEATLSSACAENCQTNPLMNMSDFADNLLKTITFDFFNAQNFDMNSLTEEAILQQACLVSSLNDLCSSPKNEASVKAILGLPIIQAHLSKTKQTFPNLCKKLRNPS